MKTVLTSPTPSKGFQASRRPTEQSSQGHPVVLQSYMDNTFLSWSPRQAFRGKAMHLPHLALSLTILGLHHREPQAYSSESPALSGQNSILCSAGTVTPSQLDIPTDVLSRGCRRNSAEQGPVWGGMPTWIRSDTGQTGPTEHLSPSIREEVGGILRHHSACPLTGPHIPLLPHTYFWA